VGGLSSRRHALPRVAGRLLGELCASKEVASRWADELLGPCKQTWSGDSGRSGYFKGTIPCLSALLAAERYTEILELLDMAPVDMWFYRQYGVKALAAMGRKAEAIRYAVRHWDGLVHYLDDGRLELARTQRRHAGVETQRDHVGVAPRGTRPFGSGYRWSQSSSDLGEAADRTLAAVDAAKERYHIHGERVFLAGYQSGGAMAVGLGLEYAEVFAGAASIESRVPRGGRPLRNINRARKTPLLIATSLEDDALSVTAVNDDLRLLHSAGMVVAMRLYPGGDGLASNMLSDLDAWVMERVCSPAHACS